MACESLCLAFLKVTSKIVHDIVRLSGFLRSRSSSTISSITVLADAATGIKHNTDGQTENGRSLLSRLCVISTRLADWQTRNFGRRRSLAQNVTNYLDWPQRTDRPTTQSTKCRLDWLEEQNLPLGFSRNASLSLRTAIYSYWQRHKRGMRLWPQNR